MQIIKISDVLMGVMYHLTLKYGLVSTCSFFQTTTGKNIRKG